MRAAVTHPGHNDFIHFSSTGLHQRTENYAFVSMSFSEKIVPMDVWSIAVKDHN